ncbi:MAG TPA: carbohydrate-binding family 9-like protein, partial [Myxococcota bacterium]
SPPNPLSLKGEGAPALATFDDRLVLLEARIGGDVVVGRPTRLQTRWRVTGELAGRVKPQVVAALVPSSVQPTSSIATVAAAGFSTTLLPLEWHKGDVVDADLDVVAGVGGTNRIAVGVIDAGRRWNIDGADGVDHLALVGSVDVVVAPAVAGLDGIVDDGLPLLAIKQRTGDVVVDGALDDADWKTATPVTLGPYRTGAATPTLSTTARLFWDDAFLYLGFDVDDDDPHSPYTRRDDALYDSEALEIFIDADGDRDVYAELQASPLDVRFDAAFAGGPRKNMDKGYDVDVEVKSRARADGSGYTQEWRIPLAQLKDVPDGEPKVGAAWRINLFRLERRRQNGNVVGTEASAWSAVDANDFHALHRFGRIVFVD